jgi:hypothetical protein
VEEAPLKYANEINFKENRSVDLNREFRIGENEIREIEQTNNERK